MLVIHTGKGVAPGVNFRECLSCTPAPSAIKVAQSGFETQRRHHQKSETGMSGATKNGHVSTKFFFKKKKKPILLLKYISELKTENTDL